jgi:uncharacterized metal-binding protein
MERRSYKNLYSDADLNVMKVAEDSLDPKLDRVREIVAYCKEAGIRRVGIANCISFDKQARTLKEVLTANGLEVAKANCKIGKVKFHELLPGYKGTSCNPAGQAEFLAENDTEINIMMGLCLGHDIIFNTKSKAPVTPLMVKDRKLDHNPLRALKSESTEI